MSSKFVAAFVILSVFTTGCGRTNDQVAKDQAAKSESATSTSSTDSVLLPGMKPGVMPAGCYLRATIDGKKWEATEMTPDESKLSLVTVNGKNGTSSITFVIGRNRENIGKPSTLSDSNEISYWAGGGFFVGAKSGQYTVTKIDDQFIEGTFNFIAEKDGKKVTCTDGEFRIASTPPSSST